MFIQTEQTPNPETLKFLPGCEVMIKGTAEFKNAKDARKSSPLAERLFNLDGIEGIFLSGNFVSITKSSDYDWSLLKSSVLAVIMDHFTSGDPVMLDENDTGNETTQSETQEDDCDIVIQIKELLDTRVRPAVAQDGGDIIFHDFIDGVVYLQMQGACAGCPSSTMTLKSGIENLLKHFIPEVVEVRPATDLR